MILIKYIQTRRELKSWEVATHDVDGHTTWRSYRLDDDDAPAEGGPAQHHAGIYDNWLLVRFSVAFFFMVYVVSKDPPSQNTLLGYLGPKKKSGEPLSC